MQKKILAWFLTLAMVLSITTALPLTAGATIAVCQIVGGSTYATLDSALDAVEGGQTIQLLTDITHNSTISVSGKSITIDVNDHILTVDTIDQNCIYVLPGYSLYIIDNGASELNGAFLANSNGSYGAVEAYGAGQLLVEVPAAISSAGDGIAGIYARGGREVYFNGDITVTGNPNYGVYAQSEVYGSLITVDGEINSDNMIRINDHVMQDMVDGITPTTKPGYITFVDPEDSATDPRSTVWLKGAVQPFAENVAITGTPVVGETLTGDYDFMGTTESGTTYRWLKNSGVPQLITQIHSTAGVSNDPRNPSIITLNADSFVTLIYTYHYYNYGQLPGTITLQNVDDGTVFGPWNAVGSEGSGSVNAYWSVYPNITLPAGQYKVIDSDPVTWSWTEDTGGRGFVYVYGNPTYAGDYTPIDGATEQTYTLSSADGGCMIKFEVTVRDSGGLIGTPVTSSSVGPVNALNDNAVCIVPGCTTSAADGGFTEYTEIGGETYYHVSTAAQLAHINEHLDLNYIQTADIDLSQYNDGLWTPIGGFGDPDNYSTPAYFSGKYLGDGYTIENLNIYFNDTDQGAVNAGVFAYIYGTDAVVSDLTVTVAGADMTAYNYTWFGAISGSVEGGSIIDCHAVYLGDVDSAYREGQDRHGTPSGYMGGITGTAYPLWNSETGGYFPAAIDGCSATFSSGSLLADGWSKYAGGIVGRSDLEITDCDVVVAENEMIRSANVGGITAMMYSKNPGTAIEDCTVSGAGRLALAPQFSYSYYIGGLVGRFVEGGISDCTNGVFVDATEVTQLSQGQQVYAGGLVGYLGTRSDLFGCRNTGEISIIVANNIVDGYGNPATAEGNEYAYAGGVAGYIYGFSNKVTVENCENNANVSSVNRIPGMRAYAGGIAGHLDSGEDTNADDRALPGVILKNCANLGADTSVYAEGGTTLAGGLAGATSFHDFVVPNIVVQDCYNRASVMGVSNSAPQEEGFCVGITAGGAIGAVGEVTVANVYSAASTVTARSDNGADAYGGGLFGVLYMTQTDLNYYEENPSIIRAVGGAGELLQAPNDLSGSYEGASESELKTKSFLAGWPWYSSGGTAPDYYSSRNPWRFTAENSYPVLKGLPITTTKPSGGGGGGGSLLSKYQITATASEGGVILPSGNTTVTENNSMTFTIQPDQNYAVKDVMVDGSSVGSVTTYTFSAVKANHRIEATFAHVCPSLQFADVDTAQWYHEGIDAVLLAGLFKGTSATTFEPRAPMTRAMMVTVLHQMEGNPAAMTVNHFADVVPGSWYANAVIWANSKGIVKGYNSDTFGPDDLVTREQLATILHLYAKFKGYDVSVGEDTNILSFEDAFDISEYAIPALQWACGAGIIQGDGAKLDPLGSGTRAQVAAMLAKFMSVYVK